MSVDLSVRDQLKKVYGDDLGDQLADLLQECIDEGNTTEKALKKCFSQKIKGKDFEDQVKKKDDIAVAPRYVVVI